MGQIDSIALAVQDVDVAAENFARMFDLDFGPINTVSEYGVVTRWADFGGCSLQLLAPLGSGGPIADFLDKRGEGLFAVTTRVDDLEESRSRMIENGFASADGEVIKAGFADEVLLRPSKSHGALFVLRQWNSISAKG
ncbi:VOC family protein [Rhodococcus sp. NPDC057014]|uniref:VOC family protein n=1 Tax=Rhodococcus sp. NPDC057014 TaxID=3346000 RepID=UPI00362D5016